MKNIILVLSSCLLVILFSLIFAQEAANIRKNSQSNISQCCLPDNFSGEIDFEAKKGQFEGKTVLIPGDLFNNGGNRVLSFANEERWIEVDLSEQKLYAWEGDGLFLESAVSSGLPYFPTPQGEFRIWIKLKAARMEGGSGRYYYNLPNVPYIMYFENSDVPGYRGYGLHGAYWHNDFGTPRSHGCVNLPIPVAKELFYWTSPVLPDGKGVVRADSGNPGTRIVIHE